MKLRQADISKLELFLEKIEQETYPESSSLLHTKITHNMFGEMRSQFPLSPVASILDIGCGQGVALKLFQDNGFVATGITLNDEDVRICKEKGFNVFKMDQSFLDFPDETFDCVWCRHCLEHSIFPYFTLAEISRVLKSQGFLYVEVPSPDTSSRHESNQNHYSVLGKSMWMQLLYRSGFQLMKSMDIKFSTPLGEDIYWAFINKKQESHETSKKIEIIN